VELGRNYFLKHAHLWKAKIRKIAANFAGGKHSGSEATAEKTVEVIPMALVS
jgi:hypothetical protein